MLLWITQNLATLLLSAGLLTAVVFIIRHMYKVRKKGGCPGCRGGCNGCHMQCASKHTQPPL